MTVNVLWLFLTMPFVVGLQCVIVVFSDHAHLHVLPKLDNFRSWSVFGLCIGMHSFVSFLVL